MVRRGSRSYGSCATPPTTPTMVIQGLFESGMPSLICFPIGRGDVASASPTPQRRRFQLCYSEISTCAGVYQRSSRVAYVPAERSGPRSQLFYQGPGEVAGRGQTGATSEKRFWGGAGAASARADGVFP